MLDKKIRVACLEDFPEKDPKYIYVANIDKAKELLKQFALSGKYQSDLHVIPGLRNIASIEVWNEKLY